MCRNGRAPSIEEDDNFPQESGRAELAEVNAGCHLTGFGLDELLTKGCVVVVYRDVTNNVHTRFVAEVGRHVENVLETDSLVVRAIDACTVETVGQHQPLAGEVRLVVDVNVSTDDSLTLLSVRQCASVSREWRDYRPAHYFRHDACVPGCANAPLWASRCRVDGRAMWFVVGLSR
jgi:hypothetical protein